MRTVPVGKTLLIAGLCALIPLVGNVVASFVTEWTGAGSWLVVPAVGVGVAMVTALVQAYGSAPAPTGDVRDEDRWPGQPVERPGGARYRRYGGQQRRRGLPLPVAVATAILVLGGGGWALAEGVRYGVGYVTGNESGPEQLRAPKSGRADGLVLTVESVERTPHFTRVDVLARNGTDNFTITLPLSTCTFRGSDGTTLDAENFKSRWTEQLSPGSLQRGTITFGGHLPESVRSADLSFANVFSFPVGPPTLEEGPKFITVEDIGLRPT